MKHHRFAAVIALTASALAALAVPGNVSIAQQTPPANPDPVIDLQFGGGTVEQYIDAIQKASGNVNVLLQLKGAKVPLPEVDLSSVHVSSALRLLEGRETEAEGKRVELDVETIHTQDAFGLPIYVVVAKVKESPAARSHSTVISVKDIIDAGYSAEDLMTAVATTIELLAGQAGKAEIRFHEQTGLLIAKGDEEQIDAIYQVMAQIRESGQRNAQSGKAEADAHRFYQQTLEMKNLIAQRDAEIAKLVQQMTEARTRAELLEKELDRARQMIEERQNELVSSQMRMHALQLEFESARRQAEDAGAKGNP